MAQRILKIIETAESETLEYVEEHLRARGLPRGEILATAQPIAQAALPELLGRYDQVWHF